MANILVVDDEVGIRELLSEILGDEGHVVTTAENAQQARDFFQACVPDLVLLDIWMPDTDGITLLKEWQRSGALTMPVIMMSGHGTVDTAMETTHIGAKEFLEKPIALQRLLKTVQKWLSGGPKPLPLRALSSSTTLTSSIVSSAPASLQAHALASNAFQAGSLHNGGVAHTPTQNLPHHLHNIAESFHNAASTHDLHTPAVDTLFSSSFGLPLREARDAFERAYFEYHLMREGGSMTRVAEKTGLERTHLYRKLKQLGVDPGRLSKRHHG